MNVLETLDRMTAVLNLWADKSFRDYKELATHRQASRARSRALHRFRRYGQLADEAQAVRTWLTENPYALD